MIGGGGFTQRSGTAWVEIQGSDWAEVKIVIKCDKPIRRKELRKFENRQNLRWWKERGQEKQEKSLHGLLVLH